MKIAYVIDWQPKIKKQTKRAVKKWVKTRIFNSGVIKKHLRQREMQKWQGKPGLKKSHYKPKKIKISNQKGTVQLSLDLSPLENDSLKRRNDKAAKCRNQYDYPWWKFPNHE